MKKTMLLAVVLLSSGLQMAAKDRDLIGMRNFRQLSGIPYDTLTPKEKDDVFFMAFKSNLPAQHSAARDLLNNKFKLSKEEWTRLENMAKDFGLESVKADFAVKTIGSRAPSAPTQVGAAPAAPAKPPRPTKVGVTVQQPAQAGIIAPVKPPRPGKGQGKVEALPQNIESLIQEVAGLELKINGPQIVTPEYINEMKTSYAELISNGRATAEVEQELQQEKQKLSNQINGYKQAADILKASLDRVSKQAGITYNKSIDDVFNDNVAQRGYTYALDQIRSEIAQIEEKEPREPSSNLE